MMSDEDILRQLRQAGGMRGRWSTLETPNDAIPGTLSLSNDGRMELTIERDVEPVEGFGSILSFHSESKPLLIGQLNEGTLCTLRDLVLIRQLTYSISARVLSQVFSVQYALFGAHIDDPAGFRVNGISILLPILMDWSNTACYSASYPSSKFIVEVQDRQQLALGATGDYAIDVLVAAGYSISALPSRIPSIIPYSQIRVSFLEHPLLDSVARLIPLIASFFSLATLSAVRVSSFSCASDAVKRMLPIDHGERPYYSPVTVWYRGMQEELAYEGLSEWDMFFTYSDLKESSTLDVLSKILARFDEFDFLLPLLVPESGDFHSYSKQRFLNATQSLEYLDRMAGHNTVLSSDEFETRKKRVLDRTEGTIRSWLKEILQHANEPNLRRRIKNTIQTNAELLQTTVEEQERFVDNVVRTRNFLVHLDSRTREGAILDDQLVDLTDKAEALARLSFLRTIGISEAALRRLYGHKERSYIRRVEALFHTSTEVAGVNEAPQENDSSIS